MKGLTTGPCVLFTVLVYPSYVFVLFTIEILSKAIFATYVYIYSEVTGRQFFLLPGTDSAPGDQIQNWAELVLVAVLYYHLPGILDPPL